VGIFDGILARWRKPVGEFGTQGPDEDEHPLITSSDHVRAKYGPRFDRGRYTLARQVTAHPGRIGPVIVPECTVVHTTDMPNGFDELVKVWQTSPGRGSCAHFILGRNPDQGLVQMVPITNNGNHAGGPTVNGHPIHGWWVTRAGKLLHPNTVSVGIEVHAAGRLYWAKGSKDVAEYIEDHKVKATFSRSKGEVYVDALGRPWHAVNEYQLASLGALLVDLRAVMKESTLVSRADAAFIKDRSQWDTSYALPDSNTLVGHVSLDPINKTDPGPQLMAYINANAKQFGWT
jgi:hypothetical protein